MEVFIKVLQVLTCFSLLVLVHEFGHFLFAKIFHTRVEKFYLFFNPWFSIFKFRIGETEYGMGWVPFGGYCKIAGMVDESMDTDQMKSEPKPWEYRSKPAWQRLLIIVGGVLMNIVLAIGIYIGITYAWGDSYIRTKDVEHGFMFSEVAHEIGFRDGDKVLSVGGEYVDNYGQIPAVILLDDAREVQVERNGVPVTVTIDTKYIKSMLKDKGFINLRTPFVVGKVLPGGGAAAAGLTEGDSLVAVDGVPMRWFDEFRTAFAEHKGDTAQVTFVRGGERMTAAVPVSAEGQAGIFLAGVNLADIYKISTRQYSFLEAVPVGVERAFTSIGSYLKQLKLIVSPETEAYKSVGGIIAMGNFFPGEWNWLQFWQITALISIMLAVLNILPIPMLDGGHMVFILYEMITRRTPSDKFMERAQLVGMVIVFGIVILANGNDILKLIFN
ncbi:RIP metalloprotease RseP [Rikenella microfusus]|uniref:RIP metalloprotease RseP n=1 Tax=Rikenella microfusus TaxID=28139 RepID=UPI003A8D10CC